MQAIRTWTVAFALLAWPAAAHQRMTDKCGCHSQYGLRHCHLKKKTKVCEAPVSGKTEPVKKKKAKSKTKVLQQDTHAATTL